MTREIHISTQRTTGNHPADFNDEAENDDLTGESLELPIDLARRGKHLIIKTPIVGATPDDISVTVNNDILFIHKGATVHKDKVDNYYTQECHWGPIAREVHLPLPVDPGGVQASLKDGILKITLPIIEKKKTKVIKIR